MSRDPIVEEVRQYRDQYAKQFKYDLRAIFLDLKEKQDKSGRKCITRKPKSAKTSPSSPI